jgi:hypothetical protein
MRHPRRRIEQQFDLLKPQGRLTRPLVKLNARYCVAPEIGSRHDALHSKERSQTAANGSGAIDRLLIRVDV